MYNSSVDLEVKKPRQINNRQKLWFGSNKRHYLFLFADLKVSSNIIEGVLLWDRNTSL